MKCKTSVTLSATLIEELDHRLGPKGNRSRAMEQALREYLDRWARRDREATDLRILNEQATRLNEEARDSLEYQEEA